MTLRDGNPVASTVRQLDVFVPTGSWVALIAGSTTLEDRQWIRLAPRGRDTIGLALKYASRNANGTFTAPTGAAYDATIIPTTSIHIEPLSSAVQLYGRAAQRGGSSGGVKVIVTEYA